MALCDILVCLDATAAGGARLGLALDLAQVHKAHVTAVYALPEHAGSTAPPAGVGLPEESASGGISISEVLLSRAADLSADMIVAGAYRHSHLRERLLGGVSRALLDRMTVPVPMSH